MNNDFFKRVQDLVEASREHEKYREKECINLIASEGLKSPAVREILSLSQDLECRYAEGDNDLEGHVKIRYYQGQKYITKIEDNSADLIKNLFSCDWVDLRLVSGTHANLVTFKGLSSKTKNHKMVTTASMLHTNIFSGATDEQIKDWIDIAIKDWNEYVDGGTFEQVLFTVGDKDIADRIEQLRLEYKRAYIKNVRWEDLPTEELVKILELPKELKEDVREVQELINKSLEEL